MPRNKPLEAHQQLPTAEAFIALREAALRYKDDPFHQLVIKQADAGEKIVRSSLKNVFDASVSGAAAPIIDRRGLENRVLKRSRLLQSALVDAEVENLPKVKLNRESALASAETLLGYAAGVKDTVVTAIVPKVRKDLSQLIEAVKRVAAGGHDAFDLKTSDAAKQAWVHHDNGFNLLAVCARNARVTNDPVLANESKVRSPLRLDLVPKATKPHKARKANAKSKKGSSAAGENGGSQKPPATS